MIIFQEIEKIITRHIFRYHPRRKSDCQLVRSDCKTRIAILSVNVLNWSLEFHIFQEINHLFSETQLHALVWPCVKFQLTLTCGYRGLAKMIYYFIFWGYQSTPRILEIPGNEKIHLRCTASCSIRTLYDVINVFDTLFKRLCYKHILWNLKLPRILSIQGNKKISLRGTALDIILDVYVIWNE